MSRSQLVIRYAGFAMLASLANLGVQRIVLWIESDRYMAALLAGTLVGLILKYVLDKRWIFFDRLADLHGETRKFGLYTLTGVGTTALFWGSETLFWLVGQSHAMRETGALLGLTLGYVIKYKLDDRYVFRKAGSGGSDSQQE